MKKRSEATQTLRAGCSKADPQTNTQLKRRAYNTLRSLARSVMGALECIRYTVPNKLELSLNKLALTLIPS